jgi:hypothetical protein
VSASNQATREACDYGEKAKWFSWIPLIPKSALQGKVGIHFPDQAWPASLELMSDCAKGAA